MPCTGSVKSGDSFMLSCLSPRRPCCGPKAAVNFKSFRFERASSECTRSRVTDAGCASSATRLPASGRRSAGSSSSLSMPSFIELQRERFAVMEIRLAGRMPERPVGQRAVFVLDDRRQADRKTSAVSQAIEAYAPLDLEPACGAAHGNARIQLLVRERNAVAITLKRVRGPLARGREIEFVVREQALAADEYLAAGVLPQPVGAKRIAAGFRMARERNRVIGRA